LPGFWALEDFRGDCICETSAITAARRKFYNGTDIDDAESSNAKFSATPKVADLPNY
jgi:hypothetical protein